MEEQREENEFVADCRNPMEEASKGKGLALSSKAETVVGKDAKTVEVLVDSGVCDENPNGRDLATEDTNTDSSASDEKQLKVDVASVEKTVTYGDVEVKPVDEREGSEICDDVQRVGETVCLVEVEMFDETAKSESVGEEETVTSAGNELTDEKVKCEAEDNGGAFDGEMRSVADDKADQEKESAKKREEDYNKMGVDSKLEVEENVALTEQGNPISETKDAKHSESASVPEKSTQLRKGTVLDVSSAGGICSEEEITNVNQKDEAMEIDNAAEEHVEKAGNELQNSMKRGTNMKLIPTDLIIEIFSRLPAKSVGRFRCLSKLWCSMLSRPDFIELFLSRSCARPRLLFAVQQKGVWRFFSSPQLSLDHVVSADFHTRFSEDVSRFTCSYASGLFYFRDLWSPRVGQFYVVCNPVTGQYVTLPDVNMYRKSRGFLGFDPVEKKFKVLAEAYPFCSASHHEILTLGTGEISWRKKNIDCPSYEYSMCEVICINGFLYYLVEAFEHTPGNVVQFDLRSEEFRFVVAECFSDLETTKLVNYNGKLGGINCSYGEAGGKYTLKKRLCVLEDVERHEWSTYVYTLPENDLIDDPSNVSIAGVIATGEIVLAMDYTCKPYYVFYFNPEKNTLQSVEIQGFGAELEALEYRGRVTAFVDHVEHLDVEDFKHCRAKHPCSSCEGCIQDLNVVDPKKLGSSIFGNQGKRFCSNCEEQDKKERQ